MPNEISFYPQIKTFIEEQLKSNFATGTHRSLFVYWGIGELRTNLLKIIREHPLECTCAARFVQSVPPLNLDIFALVTDGRKFEILILEIKFIKAAGLREWSQLVGYCLVSGAKYGLLVNIDNGASNRLAEILSTVRHISHIQTKVNTLCYEHCLGFMQWNSLTHNFEYNSFGFIKTISDLSNRLILEFTAD